MTDSHTTEVKRGPGRPSRQQEAQTQRRRRTSLGDDRNLKLYVPEQAKDPAFEYRWVNNRPGRVRHLTQEDDWDVVPSDKLGGDPDPEKSIGLGSNLERVGNQVTGESMILVRKPKEFFEEDKKAEAAHLDALDETMRRGPAPHSEGLGASDNAYVPGGRNTVNGR